MTTKRPAIRIAMMRWMTTVALIALTLCLLSSCSSNPAFSFATEETILDIQCGKVLENSYHSGWYSEEVELIAKDHMTDGKFGYGGDTWSSDGRSWSACSHGTQRKDSNGNDNLGTGTCYMCDRTDGGTVFAPDNDCYAMTGVYKDFTGFGKGGPALSSTGLAWSACGVKGTSAEAKTGCYMCDRSTVDSPFVFDNECTFKEFSIGADDGGPAYSNGGRSWSVCSSADDKCYVCDRDSVDDTFSDCSELNVPTLFQNKNVGFGLGGPAWSSDALSWSACAPNAQDKMGRCLVCDRSDTSASFNTQDTSQCTWLYDTSFSGDELLGFGGPTWSSDGKSWSACIHGINVSKGECMVCDRSDSGSKFDLKSDCFKIGPLGLSQGDSFGYGGASLSDDGLIMSACTAVGNSGKGQCYLCHRVNTDAQFYAQQCSSNFSPNQGVEDDSFGFGGASVLLTSNSNGLSVSACSPEKDVGTDATGAGKCYICEYHVRSGYGCDIIHDRAVHACVHGRGNQHVYRYVCMYMGSKACIYMYSDLSSD